MLIFRRPFTDSGQTSTDEYFLHLLSLFYVEELSCHLLKGLVTSTGLGSDAVLKSSRAALSIFLERLDPSELVDFGSQFEGLFRANVSNERLVIPLLETLAFVVESNVFSETNSEVFQQVPSPVTCTQQH